MRVSSEVLMQIAAKYDPYTLLDLLEIDMEELVNLLSEEISDNLHKFDDIDMPNYE